MTVLVVEDDADIGEAITQVLRDEGYLIETASNGEEALRVLRSGPPPALILLDLMMPVMDGWTFRAEQLRDPALTAIPLVVLSAAASGDGRATALRAAHFLHKPISPEQLVRVVRSLAEQA